MGTITACELESHLHKLGMETPEPQVPGADSTNNPIDIYRCYIAEAVSKLVDCDIEVAYDALQWTNSLAAGDLSLVAPRLKLKGIKPQELAKDISLKVSLFDYVLTRTLVFFS